MSKRNSVVGSARKAEGLKVFEALETRRLLSSALPTVTIAALDTTATESGSDYARFKVARTGSTLTNLKVGYTLGGTATVGVDYQPVGPIVIPAGKSSVVVKMYPINDSVIEPNETAILKLVPNAASNVGSPSSAKTTILDDDLQKVFIEPVDTEATEAGDPASFRVHRAGDMTQALHVYYTTSGTATEGTDYGFINNIIIPAGASSVLVTVTPIADGKAEGLETATVTLSGASRYTVESPSSFTMTIADTNQTTVSVTAQTAEANESGVAGSYLVSRVGPLDSDLAVTFAMSGTATEGDDYAPIGAVVIPAGESSVLVSLTPLEDLLVEGSETAIMTLQDGDGYIVTDPTAATVTILDDEKPVLSVVATSSQMAENGAGTSFVITRLGDITTDIQLAYTLTGTASIRRDYQELGVVYLPAGQQTVTVPLIPLDDQLVEGSETVIMTLDTTAAYTLGNPTVATVTIVDDELPVLTLTAPTPKAREGGVNGVFRITRAGFVDEDLTVSYSVSGSAVAGANYNALGALTIPAGQTFLDVPVVAPTDGKVGPDTYLTLTLDADNQYQISGGEQTIKIVDTDPNVVSVVASIPTVEEDAMSVTQGTVSETTTIQIATPAHIGYLSAIRLVSLSSVFGSNTNYWTFSAVNKGADGTGTTRLLANSPLNTTKATGGIVVISNVARALTLTPTAADLVIQPNSVIELTLQKTSAATNFSNLRVELDFVGQYTFTRVGSTDAALTLNYTMSGLAVSGTDYKALGTVTIPADQSTILVPLTPNQDLLKETAETAILTLNAVGYSLGDSKSATVTIEKSDFSELSIEKANDGIEGKQLATFKISLTKSSSSPLTVTYILGGTATEGTDYDAIGTITIPAGRTLYYVTINTLADSEYEGDETISLSLVDSAFYQVSSAKRSASLVIRDDEPVKLGVVTKTLHSIEGDMNSPGVFTVFREGTSVGLLPVSYYLSGTAKQGEDYIALGSIFIPDGAYSVDVPVYGLRDTEFEANETVIMSVVRPYNGTLSTSNTATVEVVDAYKLLSLQVLTKVGVEGSIDPVIRVNRYGSADSKLTLNYSLGGTAEQGVDYAAVGDIVFDVGQEYYDIDFSLISDGLAEPNETIVFTLTGNAADGYAIMAMENMQWSIVNQKSETVLIRDAGLPSISVTAGVSQPEQPYQYDSESTNLVYISTSSSSSSSYITGVENPLLFTFYRTGDLGSALTVYFSLGGVATFEGAGAGDYTFLDSIVSSSEFYYDYSYNIFNITFNIGESTAILAAHPYDDTLTEPAESVIITVLPDQYLPELYEISETDSSATGYIIDNDLPQVSITASGNTLTENGPSSVILTATRIGDPSQDLTLAFNLNGDAQSGVDFNGPGTVTIPAGQTSVNFLLTAIDDQISEPTEWITVTLAPNGAFSADPNARSLRFKIVDNEPVKVSVRADGNAAEPGVDGKFILTRTGDTDQTLAISYTMSGTSTSGEDYIAPGTLVFPQGQSTLEVPIRPLDDLLEEGDESVIFTVNSTVNYTPADTGVATINLADNDEMSPPVAVRFAVSGISKTATSSRITIGYHDNTKVRATTIGRGDIEILGPNGFYQIATLASVSSTTDAQDMTAVYRFIPSGYAWSSANVGTYSVYIRANQVKDIYGNAMDRKKIGQFVVKQAKTTSGFSVTTTSYATPLFAPPAKSGATQSLLFSDKPIL